MRVEVGAKHWMPFICFPLCRSLHKPGISGCSHTRITPACILSERNSRLDVTEWQDPPADRNVVPSPQGPGQAVSDQEVWRGGVSNSNIEEKPSTPTLPPHPHTHSPAPHPPYTVPLCLWACWQFNNCNSHFTSPRWRFFFYLTSFAAGLACLIDVCFPKVFV